MFKNGKSFGGMEISGLYPIFFTIIFVLILFQYSFSTLEAIFYDYRLRNDIGISFKDEIVLVVIDEESDEFLGEKYPYTYATHSRMISKLTRDEPKIITSFGSLVEPENDSDRVNLFRFKDSLKEFTRQGGAFRFGTEMDAWGVQKPPQDLEDLGHSLALINIDNSQFAKDDVSRRAILNISGENSLHMWIANRYRSLRGLPNLDLNNLLGATYLREADATFALYRYYTNPLDSRGKIKKIPFHRVVVGNFPKGFFKDKIVMIGPSYISNSSDYLLTPFNKEEYKTSKMALHAIITEALIQNKTVYQLPKTVSYVLSIALALILSITISRVKPTTGLSITIGSIAGVFVVSYLLFVVMGIWLYMSHLILSISAVYYIWVPFRAIAEYQRRYAIQEETKLLKQVENLKQNFISLMSHDLKTPVAKIAGMADVLLHKNRENPELKQGLTNIVDSTKELNKFITSILDLTKIESSNLALNMISKDVNKVIEGVIESLTYEAQNKNITVNIDLGPLYPIQIDVNLMIRVVSNLLENAIKYSGEGSTVVVKTWDDAEWAYISISDNGVGIKEEDLRHIFDKFYRVKNDASHKIKGTGLGLYLVKYFVELQGGSISASSVLNEGTTFTIKLKNL